MESLWEKSVEIEPRNQLDKDIKTDTCIIGGGMAGVLIGYYLEKKGVQCVILEADRIAGGQTGKTTAKITSQHDLKYADLIKQFGEKKARQYADANQKAIDEYEKIIKSENIECAFERLPAYLYTQKNQELLKSEYDAVRKLGIDAELTTEISLPFEADLALKFNNQAQFNPLEFIKSVSKKLTIFEHTMVKAIEVKNVITDKGIVSAERIVMATHFPFINTPGYYFLRMHQERSYVLALENAAQLDGMYIGIDENGLSFRNSGKYLLLGGGGHRTGENPAGGKYDALDYAARKFYPESREYTRWSAQDCIPLDGVPYIGRFSSSMPNVYVATGFQKWGMTSSMVSAMIISDMIIGRDSEYEIFSPQRFKLSASAMSLANETGHAVKGLSKGFFNLPASKAGDIPNGHGGVVEHEGNRIGVYKDKDGKIYAVSNQCPHLGCQLEWNPDEKSWDCPCHGSRFDYKGNLLDNPAMHNLDFEEDLHL